METVSQHTGPFLTDFVLYQPQTQPVDPPQDDPPPVVEPVREDGVLVYHSPHHRAKYRWCSDFVTWCYDHWGMLRTGMASFIITCLLVAGVGGFFAVDYVARRDGYDRYPALFSLQRQAQEDTYELTFWGKSYTFSTDPVKELLDQVDQYDYLLPAPLQFLQDLVAMGMMIPQEPWKNG